MSIGSNSINVEFFGANRQFDWLEILLVYDKGDKYLTIYNSYNVKLTSKTFQSFSLKNFTEAHSLTNEKNMRSTIQHKNICCIISLLCGVVTVAQWLH